MKEGFFSEAWENKKNKILAVVIALATVIVTAVCNCVFFFKKKYEQE